MHRGLKVLAAVAALIGAISYFSGRSGPRVEASGTDTAPFRAQLIEYVNEIEGAIPLVAEIARQGGIGASSGFQLRSASEQCSAIRESLAFDPPPGEVRSWNEMERLLSFQRAWWEIPATLRRTLENELAGRAEASARLDASLGDNDDCSIAIDPIVIQISKGTVIIASQIADLVSDDIEVAGVSVPNPVKVIVVTIRALLETVELTLETIDGLRTSCLHEKIITVLDDLDTISGKIDDIANGLDTIERLQIEEDLTRTGGSRLGILELPPHLSVVVEDEEGEFVSVRGKFEQVRSIVIATLDRLKAAEQNQRHREAIDFFRRGEFYRGQGEFKEAFTQYRAAYRAGVNR